MSDTTDTSNGSVIFVSEEKTVHVEVHPTPPNVNNFVPDTQPTQGQGQGQSSTTEEDISIIPETGKYTFFYIQYLKSKCFLQENCIKHDKHGFNT